MTPDKMHVANWLRSLPPSRDLDTDYRPPNRLEVSKASLVLSVPQPSSQQPAKTSQVPSHSSFEKADTTDDEPPSFRSSDDQALCPPSSSAPPPPKHNHSFTGNPISRVCKNLL